MQVEATSAKLAEAILPITGKSGATEKEGCRIGYSLADEALLLEVLATPKFVPMNAIKATMRSKLVIRGIRELA